MIPESAIRPLSTGGTLQNLSSAVVGSCTCSPFGAMRCGGRSEGFPLTGYFVPGRDGVGVGQDSRILPAPSLTNNPSL